MTDFLYACVQLVHNIGAVAVVGAPASACGLICGNGIVAKILPSEIRALILRKLTGLTVLAWLTQMISGLGFGATTYYMKGELPSLTGIGLCALGIKITCALVSFVLVIVHLNTGDHGPRTRSRIWQILLALGLAALISAAFLRWYG